MLLGEDLPSDDEDDMDFDVAGEGPSDSNDSDGSSSSESERNGGGSDSNTGCLDDISDGSEGEEQDREDELRSLQEEAETCLEGRQTQGKQKTASPLLVRLPAKRRRKAVDYKALNQVCAAVLEEGKWQETKKERKNSVLVGRHSVHDRFGVERSKRCICCRIGMTFLG